MEIIPAILTADDNTARMQLSALAGVCTWVQLDALDGTLFGARTCDLADLIGATDDFAVEVHLMTCDAQVYLPACAALRAQRVYVHPEGTDDLGALLAEMGEYDFARGISIAPQTSIAQIAPYIDVVDAVQVMTVEPGEQGGDFLPAMLDKVRTLRTRYPSLHVAVDGGVNEETVCAVVRSGAHAAGVGSAISHAADAAAAYRTLTHAAAGCATMK